MAPFTNAVCLVNGDTGELALRMYGFEMLAKGLGEGIFRRDVEKTSEGMAAFEIFEDIVFVGVGRIGVQSSHSNVGGSKCGDLVVHESQEGGYHDGNAMVDHGGKLVAEGFAKGGRCS